MRTPVIAMLCVLFFSGVRAEQRPRPRAVLPPATMVDLSGDWSAADARAAAAALAAQATAQLRGMRRRGPVTVAFHHFRNLSGGHVNVKATQDAIAAALAAQGLRVRRTPPARAARAADVVAAGRLLSYRQLSSRAREVCHYVLGLQLYRVRDGIKLVTATFERRKLIERGPKGTRVQLLPDQHVIDLDGLISGRDLARMTAFVARKLPDAVARLAQRLGRTPLIEVPAFRNRTNLHLHGELVVWLLERHVGPAAQLVDGEQVAREEQARLTGNQGPAAAPRPDAWLTGELTSIDGAGQDTYVLEVALGDDPRARQGKTLWSAKTSIDKLPR